MAGGMDVSDTRRLKELETTINSINLATGLPA